MILRVDDLAVTINGLHILQGVSFEVAPSGVTALLGRNGVGKTTTLRAIMGLASSMGRTVFEGSDISALRTHRRIQCGLGYVPEDRCVFAGLTVAENLRLAEREMTRGKGGQIGPRVGARNAEAFAGLARGGAAGDWVRGEGGRGVEGRGEVAGRVVAGERARGEEAGYELVFGLFPELAKRAKQKAGTLSGGQQQMLSLGRVLLNDNKLLLIDEPTKGLAPKVVTEVAEALERVAQVAPILLVEQNLAVVRRLARDAVVLSAGKVAWTGDAPSLLNDAELTKSLLGVGH